MKEKLPQSIEFRTPIVNQWDMFIGFEYWGFIDGKDFKKPIYSPQYHSYGMFYNERYIGIKDEYNEKIYENDKVEIDYGEIKVTGIIEYRGTGFFITTDSDDWEIDSYCDLKVIGHRYGYKQK